MEQFAALRRQRPQVRILSGAPKIPSFSAISQPASLFDHAALCRNVPGISVMIRTIPVHRESALPLSALSTQEGAE